MNALESVIPAFTGSMIFISVLLGGTHSERKRTAAWILGLTSQLLLFTYGGLTGNWSFSSHLLVAGAFAFNLLSPVVERWKRKRLQKGAIELVKSQESVKDQTRLET